MKIGELRRMVQSSYAPATPERQQEIMQYLLSLGIDMSSSYQELEMSSRLADTHRDTSFSNTVVQLHSHDFYEILCCRNTCGAEYLVGSRRYRLQKGDIIFVSPGVSHRPILPERVPEGYKRDVLWLSAEFIAAMKTLSPDWQQENPRSTDLLRTSGTQWAFLPELIHRGVLEYEAAQPGWQNIVIGNAMVIATHLARALRDGSTAPIRAEAPELLDRVMSYIENHYCENLSVADAALRFHVSQSTISHLFKEKLGVSFHHCLAQRRLIAAKELIARGELLEAVGEQTGFSDYSSFYRAFKREYGISPRQYRRLQQGAR